MKEPRYDKIHCLTEATGTGATWKRAWDSSGIYASTQVSTFIWQ